MQQNYFQNLHLSRKKKRGRLGGAVVPHREEQHRQRRGGDAEARGAPREHQTDLGPRLPKFRRLSLLKVAWMDRHERPKMD